VVAVAGAVQRPVVTVVALLVTALVALRLLGTLRAAAVAGAEGGVLLEGPLGRGALGPAPEETTLGSIPARAALPAPPAVEISDPRLTANVLRSWMKDA